MSNEIVLNLKKEISLNLSKEYPSLKNLTMGLGWDMAKRGDDWDLDAIAVATDEYGDVIETIYFANKNWSKFGIQLDKDNRTGEGDGPDENIFVNLEKIPFNVIKISFFVNIYSPRYGDFSGVKNAFINITDNETGKEIAIYNLNEDGRGFNAFHFGDLDKINDEWSFKAIGKGTNGSVSQIAKNLSKELKIQKGIKVEETKKKGFFSKLFS